MIQEFDMQLMTRLIKNYISASKNKKSEIIRQYAEISGISISTAQKRLKRFEKKYLTGQYHTKMKNTQKNSKRKKKYNWQHIELLRQCLKLSGFICAERLHPILSVCIEELTKNSDRNPIIGITI
ncbi:hypothetical protein [Thermodesulfovibrio hydrogeniphilus]